MDGSAGKREASGAWWRPSFGTVLFAVHLAVAFGMPQFALQDPGIGWHLKTGELNWAAGRLGDADVFSWTKEGAPVFSPSWLFQVGAARLVAWGGLPVFVVAAAIGFGLIPVLVFRHSLAEGASSYGALTVSVMVYLIVLGHWLARPHIATYLMFAVLAWALADYRSGRASWRRVIWLPIWMGLWANLHGGFLAGLLLMGIYAGIVTIEARWGEHRDEDRKRAAALWALLGGSVLATLVNPRGWEMYRELGQFLRLKVVATQMEFRPPNFGQPDSAVLVAEGLIILMIASFARSGRRVGWVELTGLLVFFHFGLGSVRHLFLFAIFAGPIVAREWSGLWLGLGRSGEAGPKRDAAQRAARGDWVWIPALSIVALVAGGAGWGQLPRDFKGIWVSERTWAVMESRPEQFRRMFNSMELGGALIFHGWPKWKVFVDDRNEVYRDDFMFGEYFPVRFNATNGTEVLNRWDVTAAVLSKNDAADALFAKAPGWERIHADELNSVYVRNDLGRPAGEELRSRSR